MPRLCSEETGRPHSGGSQLPQQPSWAGRGPRVASAPRRPQVWPGAVPERQPSGAGERGAGPPWSPRQRPCRPEGVVTAGSAFWAGPGAQLWARSLGLAGFAWRLRRLWGALCLHLSVGKWRWATFSLFQPRPGESLWPACSGRWSLSQGACPHCRSSLHCAEALSWMRSHLSLFSFVTTQASVGPPLPHSARHLRASRARWAPFPPPGPC